MPCEAAETFQACLDRTLLTNVFRFNRRSEFAPRALGLSIASWPRRAALWLRDTSRDCVERFLECLAALPFRWRPEARLAWLLRKPGTQRLRSQILERFAFLHDRLDPAGRDLLAHVAALRLLGPRRISIPGSAERMRRNLPPLRAALRQGVPAPGAGHGEALFDFRPFPALRFPVQCVSHRLVLTDLLMLDQYEHAEVRAEPGDIVLDGGAFKGETALWMASRVGAAGRVFAFEFIPAHAAMLRENLARNPDLCDRVEIVSAALWDRSGLPVYCQYAGGGARVSFEDPGNGACVAETLAIDDFLARRNLPGLDLIKLDVEGAELPTLKGAEQTLRAHRPKLAVAVYHSLEDFDTIPRFLDGLGLGYQFRLGHHAPGNSETILYATALRAERA